MKHNIIIINNMATFLAKCLATTDNFIRYAVINISSITNKIQHLCPLPGIEPALSLPDAPNNWKDDAFRWAVQTKRRSIERRMKRRIGLFEVYGYTLKKNIAVCDVCGHYHVHHTVCGNCYEKVKAETLAMQDAIEEKLKLDPVEKEVVVLYQGDEIVESKLKTKEKRIVVEMPKKRPDWFSKNLLTKSDPTPKNLEDVSFPAPKITVNKP